MCANVFFKQRNAKQSEGRKTLISVWDVSISVRKNGVHWQLDVTVLRSRAWNYRGWLLALSTKNPLTCCQPHLKTLREVISSLPSVVRPLCTASSFSARIHQLIFAHFFCLLSISPSGISVPLGYGLFCLPLYLGTKNKTCHMVSKVFLMPTSDIAASPQLKEVSISMLSAAVMALVRHLNQ